jgi:sialidase-1
VSEPVCLSARILHRSDVFLAGNGPYCHYRIPGLVCTPGGRLLACCEARLQQGDWAPSDILLCRSDDQGRTWSPPERLAAHADYGPSCMNNPVLLVDRDRGHIHLFYCHDYRRVFHRVSEDEGARFGPPTEITSSLESLRTALPWTVVALGPGHGIAHSSGRLLVPIWLSAQADRNHEPNRAAMLYSDDGGSNWLASPLVPDSVPSCNESEAAELPDGRVLLNMRNLGAEHRRALAWSDTGSGPWSPPQLAEDLPEPRCFGSMVGEWGAQGQGILWFCNPDPLGLEDPTLPQTARVNLSLRASLDGGRRWTSGCSLDAGSAGYSDLAVLPSGRLACLYERGRVPGQPGRVQALSLLLIEPRLQHG